MIEQERFGLLGEVGTPALPLDISDPAVARETLAVIPVLFSGQHWANICRQDAIGALLMAERIFPVEACAHLRASFVPGQIHPLFRKHASKVMAFVLEHDWVDPALPMHNCPDATWLHVAAHYNWVEGVELLLSHGLSPNERDMRGCTPLHEAAWAGDPEIIDLLVDHGAEVDSRDFRQGTPLAMAALGSPGRYGSHPISPNPDFAKALVLRGADLHQHTGKTKRSARILDKMDPFIRRLLELAEIEKVQNQLHEVLPEADGTRHTSPSRL
jgi:hypothetical protein